MPKNNPRKFVNNFELFLLENGYTKEFDYTHVLARLKKQPANIIDVGVHHGTPWLYNLFPESKFVLVDPQKNAEALLKDKPKDYVFINKALGSMDGKLELKQEKGKSTLLDRTELTKGKIEDTYQVSVTTLDKVINNLNLKGEIGLKIDTEGYEIEVMKGLNDYLDKLSFVVSEVSVLNRFHGSYNFSELVSFFYSKGLRFYNFANNLRAKAPRFYDCVFLRVEDPAFNGK